MINNIYFINYNNLKNFYKFINNKFIINIYIYIILYIYYIYIYICFLNFLKEKKIFSFLPKTLVAFGITCDLAKSPIFFMAISWISSESWINITSHVCCNYFYFNFLFIYYFFYISLFFFRKKQVFFFFFFFFFFIF